MSNPFDQFDASPDIAGMVTAEARRQGVDPALALRVAQQESALDPRATSRAGAGGVMQLMPGTARDMGVSDVYDPAQNIRGGVRYLKRQLDTFGDPKLALAAYNAGPGRVRAAGGVPNIAETQDYVAKVGGGNPFDQFDRASAAGSHVIARSHNGGVTIEVGGDQDPDKPAAAATASPTDHVLSDAWGGFAQPFVRFGHDVAESYRSHGGDMMAVPKIAGDVANLAGAPLQAGVNALAGVASRVLPAPNATHTEWDGLIPHMYVDGKMSQPQAQAALASDINTALQGARASGVDLAAARTASFAQPAVPGKNLTQQVRAITPQMPAPAIAAKPMTLPELKSASDAAWAKVDASGYRFPKADVQSVAKDIRQMVDDAGPELYPDADKVASRIDSLAQRGDLTPAQANRLRSQVGEKLMQPGSTEASIGGEIKARIDGLIDSANDPSLAQAREIYTRYKKVQDVTQRLEDAGVNKAASGTGGNPNAARQALKPLIKNKSSQRMRNASPEEMAALKQVVNGTPLQNGMRALSAFDPFHGRLGMMLQGGLGLKTGGASLVTVPVGMAATAAEKALAQRNIQHLLDILSTGGKAAPALPAVTPRGLIGAGVIAAPALRRPDRSGKTAQHK